MVHPSIRVYICHLGGCEGARTPQELIIPGFKKIKLIDSSVSLLWGNSRLLVYGLHMSPTWISIPTPSLRGSIRKLLTNLINTYETQNSISRRIADLLYSRKAVELCCICGYSWEHSYFKCPCPIIKVHGVLLYILDFGAIIFGGEGLCRPCENF